MRVAGRRANPSDVSGPRTTVSVRSNPATAVPSILWTRYTEQERALVACPTADRLSSLKRSVRALVEAALAGRRPAAEPVVSRGSFRLLVQVAAVEQATQSLTLESLVGQSGVALLARLDHLRGLLVDLFC